MHRDAKAESSHHTSGKTGDVRAPHSSLNARYQALENEVLALSSIVSFGMHTLDQDGIYLTVNTQELSWLGYSRDELLGKVSFDTLIAEGSQQQYRAAMAGLSAAGNPAELGITLRCRSGLVIRCKLTAKAVVDADGKFLHTQSYLFAESDRRQLDEELRIAATVFKSMEGMMVTDGEGIIRNVNRAFTTITGYSPEEVIGRPPGMLSSGQNNKEFYAGMWADLAKRYFWEGEIWNRRKDGEIYLEHLTITAVRSPEGVVTNYVGTFGDITASKIAADRIEHLAFYDQLTGLPNRRLVLDRLHQAVYTSARSGNEGAVLYIDLDEFKNINDVLGHKAGDQLLIQVAERLTGCIRKGDTVARIGGDEFVVLLEELSSNQLAAAAQAEAIGHKIMTTLNLPYRFEGHELHNSPSIGVTLFHDEVKTIEQLLAQADIAMYQAKKAGRNTMCFFDPLMQSKINARVALEDDLREAIKGKQFQLYYQVQMHGSRPFGAEGLIRWLHPVRGLVPPDQFIPLAEENGMIIPIGRWVLETACEQLKAWEQNSSTCDLLLSVNISIRQFRQPDFVEQLQAIVHHHGINPHRLKLEITESMLLEDVEAIIVRMATLRAEGIRFSLDDFGTGYSSLQYLKRLPLDQLKIDQSFIHNLTSDASDQAIVATIIAMANGLHLNVIAEGVETESQKNHLLGAGCSCYQGYLFSRPVPLAEFEALLG